MKKKKKWEKPRVEEIRWNRIRLSCAKLPATYYPVDSYTCERPCGYTGANWRTT